jgi:primase-polymerase (primpol)-like protein
LARLALDAESQSRQVGQAACRYPPRQRRLIDQSGNVVRFDTALRAANSGFVDGIGFALGDGFCGVDFDNCRQRESGIIAPDVQAYVERLGTYGEVSPSCEGIKLILRGKLPKGRRQQGNVEMYDSGRYFTVTGHRLADCPSDLAASNAELAALHQDLIEAPQTASKHRRDSKLDDRELAEAALEGISAARADNYHVCCKADAPRL